MKTKNIRTKWITGLVCIFSMLLTMVYMNNCAKSDRYNNRGYYGGTRGGNIACAGGQCQPGMYGGGNIIYGGGMGGSIDTNILATALGEIVGYGSVGLTLFNGMGGYHHNNVHAGNIGAYPAAGHAYDNGYGGHLPTGGGGITAQGTFHADQRMAQYSCAMGGYNGRIVVPPGIYQIGMTVQPGSWDESSVRNLRVQAHGPVALDLYFPSIGIYGASPAVTLPHTGEIFSNHMWGQVVIERVNGVPCQSLSFEME